MLRRNAPAVETVARMVNGPASGKTTARVEGGSRKGEVRGADKNKPEKGAVDPLAPVNDYNVRAVRHSIRVFVATSIAMKAWGMIAKRLMGAKIE